jgi:hypothetical protein
MRNWFAAGLGEMLGLGRDLSAEDLQAALKDSKVLAAVGARGVVLSDGTETTLGELFGEAFLTVLSEGKIDWNMSEVMFGSDASGGMVFSGSLVLRDADGVMGWLTFGFDKETGRLKVGVDLNFGHAVVLAMSVRGLGLVFGLEGMVTVESLEAALKDPALQETLQAVTVTVNGEKVTLGELFGSAFF